MKDNNRIILNMGVMYGRVIITMVVTLLSSRWILQALGKEDFGIYSLVAGLLSLLMFLNITMASSTQRFLSYAMGDGDSNNVRETFYFSCILHFCVGIIIVFLIEFVGLFLLDTVLKVPEGKLPLAIFVLHSLSVSTFVTVISVPYYATLIAHENMLFVACVQIGESILKLVTAISLLYYDGTRLKMYAICMMLIPVCSTIIYRLYCRYYYKETHVTIHKVTDFRLFKSVISYSAWNLIGGLSSALRIQGISMLLNSFFGVIINAAYGIASQVNGQLNFFSATIVTATRPQIVKSEGGGNRQRMLSLSVTTCKITFLMLSMIVIPIIVEMPYVLQLWLKNVPEYTVIFTRLILIQSLIFQFSTGLGVSIESVGKIKFLQIIVGGLHFLVLPIAYFMLKYGASPSSIFIMIIIEETVGVILRLLISKRVAGLDVIDFSRRVIIPSLVIFFLCFFICYMESNLLNESFYRLCIVTFTSFFVIISLAYFFVLNKQEKSTIKVFFHKVVLRFQTIVLK